MLSCVFLCVVFVVMTVRITRNIFNRPRNDPPATPLDALQGGRNGRALEITRSQSRPRQLGSYWSRSEEDGNPEQT